MITLIIIVISDFVLGLNWGLIDLTGPLVHLYLQNPGIPSPGRGIKCGHPQLFFKQCDHLV